MVFDYLGSMNWFNCDVNKLLLTGKFFLFLLAMDTGSKLFFEPIEFLRTTITHTSIIFPTNTVVTSLIIFTPITLIRIEESTMGTSCCSLLVLSFPTSLSLLVGTKIIQSMFTRTLVLSSLIFSPKLLVVSITSLIVVVLILLAITVGQTTVTTITVYVVPITTLISSLLGTTTTIQLGPTVFPTVCCIGPIDTTFFAGVSKVIFFWIGWVACHEIGKRVTFPRLPITETKFGSITDITTEKTIMTTSIICWLSNRL